MATDIVTILSDSINISGLITYMGTIVESIIEIFPSVLTLLVYILAIGFVGGIVAVIFGFLKGILDINKLLGKFKMQ